MPGKLIQVENLKVTFRTQGGDIEAVRGVSFEISQSENVAIVGESGSGKSVTALSLLKLHDPKQVDYPDGRIIYAQRDLMLASEDEMRAIRGKDISMIFQEPMTSLNPVYPVGVQIQETLKLHRNMDRAAARKIAIDLLDRVGIREPQHKVDSFPHMLSGGQRQRAMIAMALACDPVLLIADEPTTALDVTVQQQILELLKDLQRDTGMSVLLITHDLNLVRRFADRVCVMHEGQIVEQANSAELFRQPRHSYTRYLLDSEPESRIAEIEPGKDIVIQAENVRVYFPIKKGFFKRKVGEVRAVDDIDVTLKRGETLGIVGESGSGKTTLGMALLRMLDSTGQIRFREHVISDYREQQMRPLRRFFQIVFQDPFSSLSPRMTVEQIVGEGLKLHYPELNKTQRYDRIVTTLKEVGLDESALWRYPHEFSGGQRQRIAVARTVILEPDVILLDEPTSALDVSVQKQVLSLLSELQVKHKLSYLFISHDLRVVRAMSHRVIVMREGKVVESGAVADVFDNPQQSYTQELAKASIYH
ncbi:MAG: ABC transporter ATP-binding protein [Thiotrichales bacterium]|nr:MAG: ABC transporter ATP-binding protein [Thiotrichales bacterium]